MMEEVDMEMSMKILVVGNGGVGKTSLVTRFCKGTPLTTTRKTIGTDFMEREITTRQSHTPVNLMIWDTAGQDMFSTADRSYYRGAGGVVFMFSVVDRASFDEVERWSSKIEKCCGSKISRVLVANKTDVAAAEGGAVDDDEVEDLARRLGIRLYRTCVKDNVGVDDVFDFLAEAFVNSGGDTAMETFAVPTIGAIQSTQKHALHSDGSSSLPADADVDVDGGAYDYDDRPLADRPPAASSAAGGQMRPLTRRTGGKKEQKCIIS
jgi:Ras-related protein Rab-23